MRLFDDHTQKLLENISIKAILLMGGEGVRLGLDLPKQFLPLGSKRVYQWPLETLIETEIFSEIVLVCHPKFLERVEQETLPYRQFAQIQLVEAGRQRTDSSWRGIQACGEGTDYVLIHDSVRPFVSLDIIARNIKAVLETGATNTCIPSADTVLQVIDGTVQTLPREQILLGQTPQVFHYEWIKRAHEEKEHNLPYTDDCQLLTHIGQAYTVVEGAEENYKITYPYDWQQAQSQIDLRASLFL